MIPAGPYKFSDATVYVLWWGVDLDLIFFVSDVSSTTTNEVRVVSYLAIWQATFHHSKKLNLFGTIHL